MNYEIKRNLEESLLGRIIPINIIDRVLEFQSRTTCIKHYHSIAYGNYLLEYEHFNIIITYIVLENNGMSNTTVKVVSILEG